MTVKRSAKLSIGLLVSLLGTGCGLVAGVDFGAVKPNGAGGTETTTGTGTGTGTGGASTGSSSGTGGTATTAPCDPNEALDTANGVFVSATSGDDVTGNGSAIAPLKTIAKGLQAASAAAKKIVYLDEGTYPEKVVFTSSEAGIVVRGGFARQGASWLRFCDAATHTLLQAPSAIAVEVSGTQTTSGLSELTITTKAAGASVADTAGESVYAVRVSGDGTKLSLHAVTILTGDGGKGGVATPGATPPPAMGTCDKSMPACSNGVTGADAAPSKAATAGNFAAGGYTPGDGEIGANGAPGDNGAAGKATASSCTSCTGCGALHCSCACAQSGCGNYCDAGSQGTVSVSSPAGPCGCGGPGGLGGASGRGGGASVALFVAGNATVSVSYASLSAGKGGDGSLGGAAALGGVGSDGKTGSAQCATGSCTCNLNGGNASCGTNGVTTPVTSAAGQKGGNGGASSKGGGGAGAPSYAVVLVGGATLVDDHTVFAASAGGTGADGAPSGDVGPKLVLP